jgi:putative ABC transport system substrate-binding protein
MRVEAFKQGMRALGYVEGRNIVIEYRYTDAKMDQLPDIAAELVRLKMDVIVTHSAQAVGALKKATTTIPIVMNTGDPVAQGLVASLAKPGGNVTGLSYFLPELSAKQLELLRETIPRVKRVVYLTDSTDPSYSLSLKQLEPAAEILNIELQIVEVRKSDDLGSALSAVAKKRPDALQVMSHPVLGSNRTRIAQVAANDRLPTVFEEQEYAEAGGLMSYGANRAELWAREATYVDKILKGTKPADLPIEQAMKFQLVINLKTARQIGVTMPPNVLLRADRVIK